ncbi:MAG TPA: DinB family protein [Bacteroidetes bacterium]|nr:DinB family protein [Bacteroidota bacterium]
MSPQLQTYADQYRQSQEEAHRVVAGLTPAQFNWKPSPSEWSVGECLEHLNVIARSYVPAFERAASAEAPRGSGPYSYGMLAKLFIRSVRPGSRPLPTAPAMNPSEKGMASTLDPQRVLVEFDAMTERYVSACAQMEGLDYSAVKVRSPFLALLRLPLGAMVDAMGLHALRHVQQAQRVTQREGFPTSDES